MSMVNRKMEFKLYPSKSQEQNMLDMKGLHQRLYNAALESRIDAWNRCGESLTYHTQAKELTQLRKETPEYKALNAQSCQVTLKRLHLAFENFFRRVKKTKKQAGQEKPGFPRFKSFRRFKGWGYASHGDGFRVFSQGKHGKIRLSGVGTMKMRGKARQWGEVKTCEIIHRAEGWFASVTIRCTPERTCGKDAVGMDWGVSKFATLTHEDGSSWSIRNPRTFQASKEKLATLQRELNRKKRGSSSRKKQVSKLAICHRKMANQRKDFLHKTSAMLVKSYGLLATEKLNVKHMTVSGGSRKKGVNREMWDTAPGMFLGMLRVKAEEAGLSYTEVNTRKVKPSQTCPGCGQGRKKSLSERTHHCHCGCHMDRDAAAALVMLNQVLFDQPTRPGSGQRVERPSASVKLETPVIA